jgi:hypothetical protein
VSQKCPECWGQGAHAPNCNGLEHAHAEGRAEALEEAAKEADSEAISDRRTQLQRARSDGAIAVVRRIRALASKPKGGGK